MKIALFNMHDLALLLVIGECIVLAVLLLFQSSKWSSSNRYLAAFLILNAMIAIDVLTFWSAEPRQFLAAISPNFFFIFSFAFFLQGPILYWYTKSLIYRDFTLKPRDLFHLIPTLLCPIYLYVVYYQQSTEYKLSILSDTAAIYANPAHHPYVWLQKFIVVVYGFLCLIELFKYRNRIKEKYSSIEKIDYIWLKLLIGGFLIAWAWIFITHILGTKVPANISDAMGIISNYIIFILISSLVFYSSVYSGVFEGINQHRSKEKIDENDATNAQHISAIKKAMEGDEYYLNPRLTLDEFSVALSLSSRTVSTILNRHFGQNFFEFVNQYRVKKIILMFRDSANNHKTIMELSVLCGFNSKATFNRFFKKNTGLTPSQYRQSITTN